MAIVTALRERPGGRVVVELDGAPWRTVPADAIVRSGLLVGRTLDRPAARTLARELRRADALRVATRALRHRDLSRQALAERLPARAREEALAALERSGYLDDARAAAGRGAALAALEPEPERARRFLAAGRTTRWLAARGFAPEP